MKYNNRREEAFHNGLLPSSGEFAAYNTELVALKGTYKIFPSLTDLGTWSFLPFTNTSIVSLKVPKKVPLTRAPNNTNQTRVPIFITLLLYLRNTCLEFLAAKAFRSFLLLEDIFFLFLFLFISPPL